MFRFSALLGAACLMSAAAYAETVPFTATLNGASEVPANTTAGKGTATASLDTATKVLTYSVEYSGLTGPADRRCSMAARNPSYIARWFLLIPSGLRR